MEKALDMGKTSAAGSFQVLIGVAVSNTIMALGIILLGRLLTVDEFGLYGVVLIPLSSISLFRDWGINSAMTRYIASLRISHKEEEIRNVIATGFIFEIASGIALSSLSIFLASFIASSIFQRPESAFYIAVASFSIISGALLTASQSVFIGFERMSLNSLTLISQAIVKTAIGLVLVFLGYGVLGAVIGYTLSMIAAATVGLVIFYFIFFRPLRKKRVEKFYVTKTFKKMLSYGLPLSVSSILGGILSQIYALMMPFFANNTMIGNYQTASNFTVLLSFFSIPITTVLFPAFAKLNPKNEKDLIKTIFASSIKYTSILLIPATMVLMVLSGPLIGALYGEKYVYGSFFLTIAVLSNMFVLLGNLSSGNLLLGLGETRMLMKQSILTLIFGLPLGFLLIPILGITGLILASIIAGMPSMFWVLYWIWKRYEVKADFQSSFKIFAASALASVAAYLPTILLNTANWIKLIVGSVIFLTVYIPSAPIIGAVSQPDINNLRIMFSSMGIVSKIMNLPLTIAEKAAQIRTRNPEND